MTLGQVSKHANFRQAGFSDAQRADERHRSALHEGVRSIGWLGLARIFEKRISIERTVDACAYLN